MTKAWVIGGFAFLSIFSNFVHGETIVPALGARAAGRGGTNQAYGDNGYVLGDNPAGLLNATYDAQSNSKVFVEGTIAGLFPDLEYSDPQNLGVSATNSPFGLGAFTIGSRVNEDIAVGMGVYSPAGFGAKWTLEGPPGPLAGPQVYKSLGMLIRILPGVSAKLTERLYVGATLGVAVSHVELEGPHFISIAPLTGTPTEIDLQSTGAALTWSTGLQYQATDELTLAASYQSQNRFQNQGGATIEIPGLGRSHYDMTMDIVWPRTVTVGMLYKWSPECRIGLDVGWQQWSRAMDRVDLQFRNPDNPVFLSVAGPEVRDSLPLNWKDNVVVKTGIERDLTPEQTIRFGYSHNSDAVIASTLTPYLPTMMSHYFTTGYGLRRFDWEYDVAYQFSFRSTLKSGVSDLEGGDHSFASLNTQAHWLFLGATKRF